MAVTSGVFSALCLASLAGTVLLLQRFFLPLRSTPEYLLVSTFLPLFISSSIVVLVPIDLASSSAGDSGSRGIVLPEGLLLVAWRVSYWLCFVLTWAVLPILQSYSNSGHRSPRNRFIEALRENARYQLMMLAIGGVGLIYVFITSGIHIESLKGLVMALSYCYALAIAIFLMGHGLVAIPRNLMRNASIPGKLKSLQTAAPRAYDKLLDATNNLEDIEQEVLAVRKRKNGSALEFQQWIEELGDIAQLPESSLPPPGGSNIVGGRRGGAPPVITEQYLAGLTQRLKVAIHKRQRFNAEWQALVQSASDCQEMLDSARTKRLAFTKHFASPTVFDKISILNPYTRHIFHYHILPQVRRILSVFLSLASACIIWSEITHATAPRLSVINYTVVHHPESPHGKVGFAGQCIAAAWIAYMCACAYSSLTTVKVWGNYALVKRMTSGSSACFYASYAARLTVPLAYNFTGLLLPAVAKDTVFFGFLGKLITLTPLGEGFDGFFPVLILLPVAATGFNVYGWIKTTFGLGDVLADDEDDEDGLGGWREGRDLIDRELQGEVGRGGTIARAAAASRLGGRAGGSSSGLGPEAQRTGRTGPIRLRDDDGDNLDTVPEEGFFGGFMHRVKNTVETLDAPQWMKDFDGVKKPKWLGGNAGSSRGGYGSAIRGRGGASRPRWSAGGWDDESDGLLGGE
ncbi:uncharacterized protein LAJ45_11001 [Morchella importuna]|uniref:uncharacterized protein n=1 Tax=Morchella importuna TaxID=1174673 RepID=UPI001E8ED772|nr:uncharacterized protein LAJ45_11001 [Morchella importuna]KAH8144981.1 hypothetical protein LAJ45_11001 [Morchella importuna]